MGKVILDMAMSLDGFAGGLNGEDRGLNDWFFSPAGRSREIIEGVRLFGQAGERLTLAPIRVVEAPDATHLRYRVVG